MVDDHKSRLLNGLRDGFKYVTSRRVRPILKGTLAYVLAYVLIFTRNFDDLSRYPLSLTSMFIVTLAFGPGKPLGACWQAVALGMLGVLLGCAFFAILARLAPYYVAQAIVFALVVYAMSLVKTLGQRWFSFSLLSILMAFNGIYTSLLLKGVFSPTYLIEYLKAYSWGAAIVLAVNMLVFPRTSERELRKTIVTSLEHLATFAALVGKAYTLAGTPEDKAARELLSQTIKADFTFLSQKITETSVEINWSKYSMQDYQRFTDRIRMLQRTLLTAHISLLRFDDKDVEIFESKILPRTKTEFQRLRRDIDFTIREVGEALGYGPMYIKATQVGYLECLDQQKAAYNAAQPQPTAQDSQGLNRAHSFGFGLRRSQDAQNALERGEHGNKENNTAENADDGLRSSDKVQEDLAAVAKRLQEELGAETPQRPESIRPESRDRLSVQIPSGVASPTSPTSPTTPTVVPTTVGTSASTKTPGSPVKATMLLPTHWKHLHNATSINGDTTKAEASRADSRHSPEHPKSDPISKSKTEAPIRPSPPKVKYGPTVMKGHFEEFQIVQKDIFVELLTCTDPADDARLMLHQPGPSINEMYGGERLKGVVDEGDLNSRITQINQIRGLSGLLDLREGESARGNVPRSSRPFPFNLLPFADPLADLDVEKGKRRNTGSSNDTGTDDEDDDDFDDEEEEIQQQKTKQGNAGDSAGEKGRNNAKDKGNDGDDSSSIGPTPEFKTNETLVRVYSLMFAWDRFVQNLTSLHIEVKKERTSRIHFHVYEALARPGSKPMPEPDAEADRELHHYSQNRVHSGSYDKNNQGPISGNTESEKPVGDGKDATNGTLKANGKGGAKGTIQRVVEAREAREEAKEEARELSISEALSLLENKPYTPVKKSWLQRVVKWNKWITSEKSIFAGKCAAAASVFAALIFAETTRQWFINYALTSGLLTCVVALAPTLGQSLMTFVLQISGSGFGTLIGWTVLQMFKDVGGYYYNPYGICAIMAVVAIPLQYLIYERPQFFVLGLLALNSAGSIITIEHVYVDYQRAAHFDTPALRAGKAMVSLGVALAIVITFQLFVLRRPARSRLRKQLGKLVYANLAYNTILQAYVRAVLPADPRYRCKPSVLKRIERELKHREAKMQMQILELSPLIAYAAAEPSFGRPFRGDLAQTVIQANQIILDRLREGRAAIGDTPFDPLLLERMVAILSPYRRRANRINKVGLYLCAMSLMSKSPLPHDSVLAQHVMNHFVHDALLISSRLARMQDGAQVVKGDSFCRYWFYVLSVTGLQTQIKRIELACKELFGELEDDPRLR